MATEYTTDFYLLQKPTRVNTSRLPNPNIGSGQVEFATIPYTTDGNEGTSEPHTILLMELPPGTIPMPMLSRVTCSATSGGTLVVDIGTAQDPNGWASGMVLSSGGEVTCNSAAHAAFNAPTAITADTGATNATVYATISSAATVTAGIVLYFTLAYKRIV